MRDDFIATVTDGSPGTAMMAFSRRLDPAQIEAVVDFIIATFIQERRANTRYHIPENGWVDHQRYRDAYPFALGEIPLDTPDDRLTPAQRRGKALFMESCVTCHDRARVEDEGVLWEPRAVSFPRGGYSHRLRGRPDASSGATPFARHDRPPRVAGLTPLERQGEALFQNNCAFCHAADGTGRNWIGSFLEPRPRDLTAPDFIATMTRQHLARVIRDGLPGTTMPAWRQVLDAQEIDALVAYVFRVFFRQAENSEE